VSLQRTRSNRVVALSVAESRARRLWLAALTIGTFYFGYHYFAKVLPALLPAGWGW
jgi:hypothetical protein